MDLKWMPSQWQYSEEFLPQVEKVTWQVVLISAFIIVCLRVGLGQQKRTCAGNPADHRCTSDLCSSTSEYY